MSEEDRARWNARYRELSDPEPVPSPFLVGLEGQLPRRGNAIDVAGGVGGNALWMASRGLDVTLADVSEVALMAAETAAIRAGLPLQTVCKDLEADPFPPGPWDLIVCVYYLWRPIFEAFTQALAPSGQLVVCHPTRSNLQRHERPGPRFLLEDGELPRLVRGLELETYSEGWTSEGRHEARIVARRPPGSPEGD